MAANSVGKRRSTLVKQQDKLQIGSDVGQLPQQGHSDSAHPSIPPADDPGVEAHSPCHHATAAVRPACSTATTPAGDRRLLEPPPLYGKTPKSSRGARPHRTPTVSPPRIPERRRGTQGGGRTCTRTGLMA